MIYGSESLCLGQNGVGMLKSTGRAMCGMILVDRNMKIDQMQILNVGETVDQLAKANSVR